MKRQINQYLTRLPKENDNVPPADLNNTGEWYVILSTAVDHYLSIFNSMNKFIRQYGIVLIFCSIPLFLDAQMGKPAGGESIIEEAYTGKWKFVAPDAPAGSTEGDIQIRSDAVIMTFDNAIDFRSTWIKFRNDSIIYKTEFDAATVVFSVKIIDKNNMEGKAVWEDGETAFILTKNLGVKL